MSRIWMIPNELTHPWLLQFLMVPLLCLFMYSFTHLAAPNLSCGVRDLVP